MFAMAAMGGGGGGSRVKGVNGGGGGEDLGALKSFMATMDPIVMPEESPRKKKKQWIWVPKPVAKERSVIPAAFKEELIPQEYKVDDRPRIAICEKELPHLLAHIGDPKRRINLRGLDPDEVAYVDNAIQSANTAREMAAERVRLARWLHKKKQEVERAQEVTVRNLSEYVRAEAEAKRAERAARQEEEGQSESFRQRETGHASARSYPSARSVGTAQSWGATQSGISSARSQGSCVILSPRGTRRRYWTPRSRTPRSEFDDETPWSTPYSSPRFRFATSLNNTPRGTPRTARTDSSTPRASGWMPSRSARLLEETASSRFRYASSRGDAPSMTPRTPRTARSVATPRGSSGLDSARRQVARV